MSKAVKTETIDITPTWIGLLPILVELSQNKDPKVRGTAWAELQKMARAADQLVEISKKECGE